MVRGREGETAAVVVSTMIVNEPALLFIVHLAEPHRLYPEESGSVRREVALHLGIAHRVASCMALKAAAASEVSPP